MSIPAPPFADIEPMHFIDGKGSFSDPAWIFELKFDGYRVLAHVDDGQARLKTRNGADVTSWFPEVAAGLAKLPGGPYVFDGEVCVFDDTGRSDFNRLQDRTRRRRWYEGAHPVVFCAFYLLVHWGDDIRGWSIEQRKNALAGVLAKTPPAVLHVRAADGMYGEELFGQAVALQLEGVVAKRLGSVYLSGARSADWLKVKRPGAAPTERFKR